MGILDTPGMSRRQFDARTDGTFSASGRNMDSRLAPKPPITATPTITLSSGQPAATPTNHYASLNASSGSYFGSLNTSEFTFLGGKYVKAGYTYPQYLAAKIRGVPNNIGGYGSAIVECISDAPSLAFYQYLGEGGGIRVLVDGIEVYRCAAAVRTGTAQAGAASTITLDSTANSVNGYYATRWVRITSGTGAGQTRQISAYAGSTKIATVHAAWTTVPDATSVFEVAYHRMDNNTVSGNSWTTLDWLGERRFRRYRFECAATGFYGVQTDAISTVAPAPPSLGTPTVWAGDSFSEGAGSEIFPLEGVAVQTCRRLGWSLCPAVLGGTGWLSSGTTGGLALPDRLLPPANAWWISTGGATAGSYTLTQSGVSATIAYNSTLAQLQAILDTSFGAGYFAAVGTPASSVGGYLLLGRGAGASVTAPMSADFTSMTAGFKSISRYQGEVTPNIPVDGDGNSLPFNLVIACGRNDAPSGNAAFTRAALVQRVTDVVAGCKSVYPTGRIWIVGVMYLPGNIPTEISNVRDDILTGCQNAGLPKIKGVLPFIDTLSWFSGSGYLGGQTGAGNSDVCVHTDAVHPTPFGHALYGARIAQAISQVLGREVNPVVT